MEACILTTDIKSWGKNGVSRTYSYPGPYIAYIFPLLLRRWEWESVDLLSTQKSTQDYRLL